MRFLLLNYKVNLNPAQYGYVPYKNDFNYLIQISDQLDNLDGCSIKQKNKQRKDIFEKSALLVRRGNCSFSNKSKIAQDQKYDLLIIVDNKDQNIN